MGRYFIVHHPEAVIGYVPNLTLAIPVEQIDQPHMAGHMTYQIRGTSLPDYVSVFKTKVNRILLNKGEDRVTDGDVIIYLDKDNVNYYVHGPKESPGELLIPDIQWEDIEVLSDTLTITKVYSRNKDMILLPPEIRLESGGKLLTLSGSEGKKISNTLKDIDDTPETTVGHRGADNCTNPTCMICHPLDWKVLRSKINENHDIKTQPFRKEWNDENHSFEYVCRCCEKNGLTQSIIKRDEPWPELEPWQCSLTNTELRDRHLIKERYRRHCTTCGATGCIEMTSDFPLWGEP